MTGYLAFYEKSVDKLGNTVEMKVWKVPMSVQIPHGYKYSLVYIVSGKRVIGYDNAEGKRDHKHIGEREYGYRFEGMRRLVRDFQRDVEAYREKHHES